MSDDGIDWSLTTWEGNRRRQREAFRALTFRQKVEALERMAEVAALFRPRHVSEPPTLPYGTRQASR